MPTQHVSLEQAGDTVASVMMRGPRVWQADDDVASAHEDVANPRVKLLLVCDGDRFLGAVASDAAADAHEPATKLGTLADTHSPRISVDASPQDAVELMAQLSTSRLPVVDARGDLAGLVCWNGSGAMFCVDG